MAVPKIVTIGKATQDVFLRSASAFRPEAYKGVMYEMLPLGQKLDLDDVVFATGGNVTNAAVTFARQGLNSQYMWAVGADIASRAILEALDSEGVDTQHVIQSSEHRASYSVVLLSESGERTILNYRGTKITDSIRSLNLDVLKTANWVYVSALGDMELLERIVSISVKNGVKVMLNPAGVELKEMKKLKALLEDIEVLVVNKEEAQEIVEGTSLEELARHATHYCPVVIVSDGPNGAVSTDGKTIVTSGMYEDVPVIDRTGGGDAFGSGFLSYWSQGRSLKDSIVFASANSTSVVGQIGAKAGILYRGTVLHAMPLTEKAF